ncbi:thioredoxin family protein [Desulfobacter vibrioformis]|uniref:thioredoxin family protein n=1 Tax=Desulfobacter vibrioformis TaxID=34031 RepID=UPI000691A149|nr:thioredoxin family protein [Desulfobacter vibrioformis]
MTIGAGTIKTLMLFAVPALVVLSVTQTAWPLDLSEIPEKGTITMIDLGAKKCIPCKMMAPILNKLEKAYEGNARIIFIDVWENRDQAARFEVRAIPTQIFFNENGKEVYRHLGFLDEADIVRRLTDMGAEIPNLETKE